MAQHNPDSFDGYRKWLGISEKRRPPTHYELLGISLDEDDPDVIQAAAEQRRRFVESKRGQSHEAVVNEILYQIGEAKFTLLNPELRRDYDRRMDLFEKRRRRRQIDPHAPRSRFEARPGRTVGEESGIVGIFAGVMAVLILGIAVTAWISFQFPWSKPGDKANAVATPAVAEIAVPNAAAEIPLDNAPIEVVEPEPLSKPVLYLPGDLSIPNIPSNPMFTKKGGRDAEGKIGRAIDFNGNDHSEVKASLPLGNAPRTLAVWLRNDRGPANKLFHAVTQGPIQKTKPFGIMEANGRWRFFDYNGGLDSGIAVDRQWHHHAITFDGQTIRYFFDGKQVASTDRKLETVGDVLKIGGLRDRRKNFVGMIDELYVFDVPLSESQIQQLMTTGPASSPATGDEWVSLFNGNDLSGWRFVVPPMTRNKPNASECWTVDANRKVLVAHGSQRYWTHWLETEEQFGDFVLELEWRFPPTGTIGPNGSGIVVRSSGLDQTMRMDPQGIEIDFRPPHGEGDRIGTGCLIAYDAMVSNRNGTATPEERNLIRDKPPGAMPAGGWNTCKITCHGDRLTVVMNGEQVNEGWNLERTAGAICLRSQKSDVEFRNIRIRPIGDGNPPSSDTRQTPATAEEELSQRLKGGQWINTNKVTFEWTADGRFLHNGVEREWKVLDGQRVQIIFGPNHKDALEFNADFT